MGFRSFIRSVNASVKRAETEQRRYQRAQERQQRQSQKMAELRSKEVVLQQNADRVDFFNNLMEELVSLHKKASSPIDWVAEASLEKPSIPVETHECEREAVLKFNSYEPTLFERLFKLQKRSKEKLMSGIDRAIMKDKNEFESRMLKYNDALAKWEDITSIANRVIGKDVNAFIEVIKERDPFSKINYIGIELSFEINDPGLVVVTIMVNKEDKIPNEIYSLTSTGKVSTKPMAKSRFIELYQDHVCSASLRIAREMFALLPVNTVIVNAEKEMIERKTGHVVNATILSVMIERNIIEKLNIDNIDPSHCMSNFRHNINFSKNEGLLPVDHLKYF